MRTYSSRNSDSAAAGCVGVLIFCLIFAVIGAFCWTYTINTWLTFAGKPQAIVWWQGALIGFVPYLGRLSIPAAVVTWLLMLILQ